MRSGDSKGKRTALLSLEDRQIAVRVRMNSVVLLQKVWDDCPWIA
jgi:hypothetical protein